MSNKPTLPLPPRQYRVVNALRQGVWIPREQIDRISGASNGPEVIRQIRCKLGYDAVRMERTEVLDRDGRLSRPGRYRLTRRGHDFLNGVEVKLDA